MSDKDKQTVSLTINLPVAVHDKIVADLAEKMFGGDVSLVDEQDKADRIVAMLSDGLKEIDEYRNLVTGSEKEDMDKFLEFYNMTPAQYLRRALQVRIAADRKKLETALLSR